MTDPKAHPLPSLGVEIEMPVIDDSGATGMVDERYFTALQARRGADARAEVLGARTVAISSPLAVNGVDNGWNLLETAHAPVPAGRGGLTVLARRMRDDMVDVGAALAVQGLRLTSLAQHPTAGCGAELYRRAVAPKPVYDYLTARRGWTHAAGIDAKAQNGPTTGAQPDGAVTALNLMLAAAPAFIALFANSPFENGRRSGFMETRMTLWPRMVASSRFPSDGARVGLPPRWFTSLGDYFAWTFAPGTVMQAVPAGSGSYKGSTALFEPGDGRMNAMRFLSGGPVTSRAVEAGKRILITPTAAHFEFLQWSNFLDFRLRFAFAPPGPRAEQISTALADPVRFLPLFRDHASNLYIENRCAGATFADADLAARAPHAVQASCMIAPLALQAGLMAAAPLEGAAFCARWPVARVARLRTQAIRAGLTPDPSGDRSGLATTLRAFCREVLDLARVNLPTADQGHLAYADWVLDTGLTGAQRAIDHRAELGRAGEGAAGLQRLARAREAVPPPPPNDG
ncbi:glutamate-cysteine ligase family protein [Lutimaribacter sp. EGI FJ00015]|nr:glutamate-cysteine ligase family protein [Lutimaribacter sp. EGI FJ00015]MCO0637608.1 glutamate-cysteine ligase family protein [Lutimaribacter sp. EGI FJ00014]